MKYAVVGNRYNWSEYFIRQKLKEIIKSHNDIIISGGAIGVDTYAQDYARYNGLTIIIHYPDKTIASPYRYFKRNTDIAKECDILIAFDKKSGRAGTKNTIAEARKLGKKIIEIKDEKLPKN